MTTSEAPPTFPSLLSRKGTAGRYIFFFFLLLLSFFFFFFSNAASSSSSLEPVTADYGTSASGAAPVTRSLGFGWRIPPLGQAFTPTAGVQHRLILALIVCS